MPAKASFDELAELASKKDRLHRDRRAIIAHEIVLYDVIYALHKAGHLTDLVMRGGTALRLCHASQRYSENLLFALRSHAPKAAMRERIETMGQAIRLHTQGRYDLRCEVRDPQQVSQTLPDARYIETWRLALQIAPNLAIDIDIQQAQSHTSEAKVGAANYEFLPAGYDTILLQVATPGELMAEIITTLADGSERVRSSDIYDLLHLQHGNHEVPLDLLEDKIEDAQVMDFEALLEARIRSLPALISSETFQDDLRALLPPDLAASTIDDPDYRAQMSREMHDLLTEIRHALYPRPADHAAP